MWEKIKAIISKIKKWFVAVAAVIGAIFTAVFLTKLKSGGTSDLSKEAKSIKKEIKKEDASVKEKEAQIEDVKESLKSSKEQLESTVDEVKDSLTTDSKEARDQLAKEFFKDL